MTPAAGSSATTTAVTDDARIVADIVVGGLLARWLGAALQLIVLKALIKPAAVWAGRSPYRWLDRLLGGVLPGDSTTTAAADQRS